MPQRHLRELWNLYRDKDHLVQRLVLGLTMVGVWSLVLLGLSVRGLLTQPTPVTTYAFTPLLVGIVTPDGVETPMVGGVPAVTYDSGMGVALVPIVLERCTSDGPVTASSSLTVAVKLRGERPTLIPGGAPVSITFDDGCTGVTSSVVLLDEATVEVAQVGSHVTLRFTLVAEDRATVVVESEPFRLVAPDVLQALPTIVRQVSADS